CAGCSATADRDQAGSFSRWWALSQASLRNTGDSTLFDSRVSVSRATHLPRMRGATLGLFWAAPPPLPSVQLQSLPNISLSWWRWRKSRVKAAARDRALLPELADRSPYRLG